MGAGARALGLYKLMPEVVFGLLRKKKAGGFTIYEIGQEEEGT